MRAATTRFYQNLLEDLSGPVFAPYHLATGEYYFSGDEASQGWAAAAMVPYVGVVGRQGRNAARAWRLGDNVYAPTAQGNVPAWSTVRSRFWKNEAASLNAAEAYGAENVDRMRRGLAPQRYNADRGAMESMELSHEPIPLRDGGRNFVPRWPQDHAAVDPFRRPGY
jgi:filamentous hemagglutinin